jgi:hypothetical protein
VYVVAAFHQGGLFWSTVSCPGWQDPLLPRRHQACIAPANPPQLLRQRTVAQKSLSLSEGRLAWLRIRECARSKGVLGFKKATDAAAGMLDRVLTGDEPSARHAALCGCHAGHVFSPADSVSSKRGEYRVTSCVATKRIKHPT